MCQILGLLKFKKATSKTSSLFKSFDFMINLNLHERDYEEDFFCIKLREIMTKSNALKIDFITNLIDKSRAKSLTTRV